MLSAKDLRNTNIFGFWLQNYKPDRIKLLLHQHFWGGNSLMAKYSGRMLNFED